MRYCIKRTFILPNTVEETKEILAQYYKDIEWSEEDIEEILKDVKTWKDVESFFDEFEDYEFNELEQYFDVEYGSELVEKE
jgi:hypothetical protein